MIKFSSVTKKFNNGTIALSDINLNVEDKEFVFLIGASGAGKTTLLRLLTKDLGITTGQIVIDDINVTNLKKEKIQDLRKKIGVVYQDLKLLPDRTIKENVSLALEVQGEDSKETEERAVKVLKKVNLDDKKDMFPLQLSGGELQRTAIARALIIKPEILLADEPTGNLDLGTAWEIINLLEEINCEGTTVIMATHNTDIVGSLKRRVIRLEHGKIIKDSKDGQYS